MASRPALVEALKNAADLIDHAIEIGHLGEGSTKGWAEDVLKEINALLPSEETTQHVEAKDE